MNVLSFLFLTFIGVFQVSCETCNQRSFGDDSFVCVCNEDVGCGTIGTFSPPLDGYFNIITSSRDEARFLSESCSIANSSAAASTQVFVNGSDVRQQIIGFGGAFTDSTGINILSLTKALQDEIVRQYYSPEGLEYNIGRVPIAGTDFSTFPYSYDDFEGDVELLNFNLTKEDYFYKIPFIKQAVGISGRAVKLFASPWSPPSWMKTNGKFNGSGGLLPEFQQPWANYFVKFLDAYTEEGIVLWGLTVQNEPTAGALDYAWNACRFTAEEEKDFVRDYLGPALTAAGYRVLKLMIGDDSRHILPEYPTTILTDPDAAAFVDGVAIHWYSDPEFPVSLVRDVHNRFPDRFLLYTEACNGYIRQLDNHVLLGSWNRAEIYAADIIENVNNWVAGWTDWNMALDMIGGPNWASNFVDSTIIVNADANEFYKQPMFYAMGHFSKFVTEGSIFLGTSVDAINSNQDLKIGQTVDAASFIDPSGYVVVVILNKKKTEETVAIVDSFGNSFSIATPAKSLQTVIYHP